MQTVGLGDVRLLLFIERHGISCSILGGGHAEGLGDGGRIGDALLTKTSYLGQQIVAPGHRILVAPLLASAVLVTARMRCGADVRCTVMSQI